MAVAFSDRLTYADLDVTKAASAEVNLAEAWALVAPLRDHLRALGEHRQSVQALVQLEACTREMDDVLPSPEWTRMAYPPPLHDDFDQNLRRAYLLAWRLIARLFSVPPSTPVGHAANVSGAVLKIVRATYLPLRTPDRIPARWISSEDNLDADAWRHLAEQRPDMLRHYREGADDLADAMMLEDWSRLLVWAERCGVPTTVIEGARE
jgi:hypothetical protein